MRKDIILIVVIIFVFLLSRFPTPNEYQARGVVEKSIVNIFRSLPHPKIAPEYNSFQLYGLYHSLSATIHAHYRANEPANEVCRSFLKVLNQKLAFETAHSKRGECLPRPSKDMVFNSIDGKKDGNRNWIDFSATEKNVGGKQMAEIEIWLTHTLNRAKWSECIANDSGEVKSFCHSNWNRPLESVSEFLSHD